MSHGRAGRIRSALILLGLATGLAVATPATAHDQLVESFPMAGDRLEGPPVAILLAFGEELREEATEVLETTAQVVVTNAEGEIVVDDPGRIAGTVLVVPVRPALAAGTYLVTWRVVDSAGHIVDGSFDFTVGDGPPVSPDSPTFAGLVGLVDGPTATQEPVPSGDPVPSDGPDRPEEPSVDPPPDPTPGAEPSPGEAGSRSPAPWILGGVVVLGATAWWVVRRRR